MNTHQVLLIVVCSKVGKTGTAFVSASRKHYQRLHQPVPDLMLQPASPCHTSLGVEGGGKNEVNKIKRDPTHPPLETKWPQVNSGILVVDE